jgi:hypothetical protein
MTDTAAWHGSAPELNAELRTTLLVEGLAYIARVSIADGAAFVQGLPIEVPVEFMFPDKALPKFTPGTQFKIWAGKDVGTGEVLSSVDTSNNSLERTREG